MKKEARPFIFDIFDSINKIESYTKNISKSKFLKNSKIQDAVIRRIEILGEATKNIPEEFKKTYAEIPWSEIAKTRDKLIHGYFGINLERVWVIIKKDLPDLKKKIKNILKKVK